jgi:HEAT repeat protein
VDDHWLSGFIQQLRSGTDSERWGASQTIGEALRHDRPSPALREELVDALVSALGEAGSSSGEHHGIRSWCCHALGDLRIASQSVMDALGSVVERPDGSAAESAARSLVKFGRPALPRLLEYLRSNQIEVRRRTAQAFSRSPELGWIAIDALEAAILDEDSLVSIYACDAAAGIGIDAAPMLCRVLSQYPADNYRLSSALAKMGSGKLLKDLLLDPRAHVRAGAAHALSSATFERSEGAQAIPALGAALKDNEDLVREWAARALEHLAGDPWKSKKPTLNAVKDELLAATEDKNETVRNFALRCLDFVDSDTLAVVDTCIKRLADSEELIRGFAADGLAHLGGRASKATPALVALLQSDKGSRYQTLNALARIGRSAFEAVPVLVELSKRSNGYERDQLLDALKRIDPDAYDELFENEPREIMHGDFHEPYETRGWEETEGSREDRHFKRDVGIFWACLERLHRFGRKLAQTYLSGNAKP